MSSTHGKNNGSVYEILLKIISSSTWFILTCVVLIDVRADTQEKNRSIEFLSMRAF